MSISKPIIFKDEMVKAILGGWKTQTRRIANNVHFDSKYRAKWKAVRKHTEVSIDTPATMLGDVCPFGKPGHRLWVRENFRLYFGGGHENVDGASRERFESFELEFQADGAVAEDLNFLNGVPVEGTDQRINYEQISRLSESGHDGFRPSIHMPRWASRITLEITDVRVERLQDISEDDAKAEGVQPFRGGYWRHYQPGWTQHTLTAKGSFLSLWNSINGPASWDLNPWVWVVEFKRIDQEAAR